MEKKKGSNNLTFWDHLDELRSCLIKIAAVVVVFGIVAFLFKEQLFSIVLAPKGSDFITYRFFQSLTGGAFDNFTVQLINTGLASQFIIHMKVAMYFGLLCASPYVIFELFRFVSPALYANERKYSIRMVGGGYLLFVCGVLLSYFVIFPFTFRFLGTYQVRGDVENLITLQSYIDTLVMLSLMLGAIFELPILCWLLAKLGLIKVELMRRYRRHAIVIILFVAALITPTSDIFTLSLVSLPIYLLYEVSVVIVGKTNKKAYLKEN